MQPLSTFGMTFDQLIDLALLMADDPMGERFSRARAGDAVNDAMCDLALQGQIIIKKTTLQLKKNQVLYDLRELIPDFAYPLRVVAGDADSSALKPVSHVLFDLTRSSIGNSAWTTDFCAYGWLEVEPPPLADGAALPAMAGNIQVTYVAYPALMVEGASPDTLQAQFHNLIAKGAASRLLDEGDEEDLIIADALDGEFQMGIADVVGETYQGHTQYQGVRPL
jgi:hypothetical protein